ncbi:hypothetical protein EDD86DRAFT_118864 [Gorgonomyces haynaldii]|nr:hypothetical protein EDD86DRAFT_118864 [Gorgonomyces haynaldii]
MFSLLALAVRADDRLPSNGDVTNQVLGPYNFDILIAGGQYPGSLYNCATDKNQKCVCQITAPNWKSCTGNGAFPPSSQGQCRMRFENNQCALVSAASPLDTTGNNANAWTNQMPPGYNSIGSFYGNTFGCDVINGQCQCFQSKPGAPIACQNNGMYGVENTTFVSTYYKPPRALHDDGCDVDFNLESCKVNMPFPSLEETPFNATKSWILNPGQQSGSSASFNDTQTGNFFYCETHVGKCDCQMKRPNEDPKFCNNNRATSVFRGCKVGTDDENCVVLKN